MKREIKVGGIYLCKDGRIRKVLNIKARKRWSWEKRFLVEIVHGKAGRTDRTQLSELTLNQYIIAEVPAKYHDRLQIFPAVHALKQTLAEIEPLASPPMHLIYRAMSYAAEAGLDVGVVNGWTKHYAKIALPNGVIDFEIEPTRMWPTVLRSENEERLNEFLQEEEA